MTLTLDNLTFSYGRRAVLKGVDASWETGQMVGLLGPNGAGKSTLVTCVAQLRRYLGEARAAAMGINVARVRSWTLVGVALLAALSVAFVGIIGFVGLVGPHMARGLVGEDQRFLVPASILAGATLLTAAHTASQVIVPGVAVPVGILTALVGVPVFLTIIFGRQRSAVRSGS